MRWLPLMEKGQANDSEVTPDNKYYYSWMIIVIIKWN